MIDVNFINDKIFPSIQALCIFICIFLFISLALKVVKFFVSLSNDCDELERLRNEEKQKEAERKRVQLRDELISYFNKKYNNDEK